LSQAKTQSFVKDLLTQIAIGLAFTALAFVVRLAFDEELIDRRPYVTFYLAVVFSARFGGVWSGTIATLLGGMLGLEFFSQGSSLASPVARMDYALYLLISIVVTVAYETLRVERSKARRYAAELEESQSRLQTLLENSPTGIYLKDAEGRYLLLNREYARILGADAADVLGKTDMQLMPAAVAEKLRRNDLAVLMTGAPINIEKTMVVNGEDRHFISTKFPLFDSRGWPVAVGSMSIDITDRRRLEEQLLHSQKMDSIGRLAGGIAHDFNNLLTAIIGYAELAEMRVGPEHPVIGDIKQIRNAGERAASLTAQLLSFARKHVQERQIVNLNLLALQMHSILERVVGEQIQVVTDLQEDLWSVYCDTSQFEQVMLNLVVNARDSISGFGEIQIRTRNVSIEAPLKAIDGDVERGDYALVSISDTGSGIDPKTLENIFEPFFTTKEKGRGTGLGLATVYGIVRQHDGQLVVETSAGTGSTFHVYLPRVDESRHVMPRRASSGMGGPLNGTILLVEPNHDLMEIAVTTLTDLGYHVIPAETAQDAVDEASAAQQIDLLISDSHVPPLSGKELAEEVGHRHPNLRALFVSNGDGKADSELKRPYTAAEIAAAARRALEQPLSD
jgi:PAS domain S-box-containing protein